jgi:hypothetical protein
MQIEISSPLKGFGFFASVLKKLDQKYLRIYSLDVFNIVLPLGRIF